MLEDSSIAMTDLAELVAPIVGRGSLSLKELSGGGSARRFLRVTANNSSVVVMIVPDQPGENSRDRDQQRRWPFLEVRDALATRNVRVPNLYREACSQGILVIEDLGDDTLARFIGAHPEFTEMLYQAAVADLVRAQQAFGRLPEGSIIAERAFDEDLLFREVQHFYDWALVARGIQLSSSQQRTFEQAAHFLAQEIASWPRGFVHRDYQSRNLMVRSDPDGQLTLTWIDFQDAMLGPRVYDLVALLTDSYQKLSHTFVSARLRHYADLMDLSPEDRKRLAVEFDLVTAQRKLKDAGRFIYFDRVNQDPSFLQFVEPTIDRVMAALGRTSYIPELANLLSLLRSVKNASRS